MSEPTFRADIAGDKVQIYHSGKLVFTTELTEDLAKLIASAYRAGFVASASTTEESQTRRILDLESELEALRFELAAAHRQI